MGDQPSRRAVLGAGLGLGLAAVGMGGAAVASGRLDVPSRLRSRFADTGPKGVIPDVPAGRVRLERVRSAARGRTVGFWTAVPHGHGDGAGLPVCLILHGASATTDNYTEFGFARFLTDCVLRGTAPFVLAGADGGVTRWEGGPGDDPQRMLAEELPRWCADRGYDSSRLAAYAWSMGGYGALRLMETRPALLRAVALLSPAVLDDDAVLSEASAVDGRRLGVWCGRSDSFFGTAQALATRVSPPAAVARWDKGAHTRGYWNRVTPDAFAFVGRALGPAA